MNPRGDTPTGLAGRRPTRLGDPGTHRETWDNKGGRGYSSFPGVWKNCRLVPRKSGLLGS